MTKLSIQLAFLEMPHLPELGTKALPRLVTADDRRGPGGADIEGQADLAAFQVGHGAHDQVALAQLARLDQHGRFIICSLAGKWCAC